MQSQRGAQTLHIPPLTAWLNETIMGRGAQQALGMGHQWDVIDAWTRMWTWALEPWFTLAQSVPWSPLRLYEAWLGQMLASAPEPSKNGKK